MKQEITITTERRDGRVPKGYPSDYAVKVTKAKVLLSGAVVAEFDGIHAEQQAQQAAKLIEAGSPLQPQSRTVADVGMAAVHGRSMKDHPVLL